MSKESDRMLDDLKNTVGSDLDRKTPIRQGSFSSFKNTDSFGRSSDGNFLEIFRSSSRSGSRSSDRPGVEDGGRMRHHHQEYTTPDKKTRVVREQYEYDSGAPAKPGHYQKKVMKSTYSSYKTTGNITDGLDDLKRGPPEYVMEEARKTSQDETKVLSASQNVANTLVDALSNIARDGGDSGTMQTDSTDDSTLTRLRRNIDELDSIIDDLDREEDEAKRRKKEMSQKPSLVSSSSSNSALASSSYVTASSAVSSSQTAVSSKTAVSHSTKHELHSVPAVNGIRDSSGKLRKDLQNEIDSMEDFKSGEVRKIVWRNRYEKASEAQDSSSDLPALSMEEEARRQRRRPPSEKFEESPVSANPPLREPSSKRQLNLQYAVYWPSKSANASEVDSSWPEPIPLPTPPQQLSPREAGVAYIYNYGSSGGSQIRHLPPLNYVQVPGPTSVPPSDGAPSPTPSSVQGNQPIIYHYSYHYTLQPGQTLPDGLHQPPGYQSHLSPHHSVQQTHHPVSHPHSATPTLIPATQDHPTRRPATPTSLTEQVIPKSEHHASVNVYTDATHRSTRDTTTKSTTHYHPGSNIRPSSPHEQQDYQHKPTSQNDGSVSYSYKTYTSSQTTTTNESKNKPFHLHYPRDQPEDDLSYPKRPSEPSKRFPADLHHFQEPSRDRPSGADISISLEKTTTSHAYTTRSHPGGSDLPPATSTPYATRGRSRSPSPEKEPLRLHGTSEGIPSSGPYPYRGSYSDSLERVRRPKQETLPFPETSPLIHSHDSRIPKRVDDLMTSFSDSEVDTSIRDDSRKRYGVDDGLEVQPLVRNNTEVVVKKQVETKVKNEAPKKELSKPVAGPPVYYPPGHELFHETMHTMTLKESNRRGKAKWRMEKSSGYKDSSSHSESKGGMAMVPVCLPLCCGAACVVM